MSERKGLDWPQIGVGVAIVLLILISVAWSVLMVWWLVWSIMDLSHGNPVTGWNILGLVIPAISIIGSIARSVAPR